jgi:hypothetical protein
MNNTSTRTEILEALDNVENVTMESSLDVMFTMADSYDKAAVILENYNGSDLSAFSIFQEDGEGENKTAVQQGDASGNVNAEAKKKQNIFVKIWNFIKSIFKSIGDWIKKCWNGFSFPEITKGSDKANKLLDAADGKDEAAWVTFAKQHLGVDVAEDATMAGLITLLAGILTGVVFKKPAAAVVTSLAGIGLTVGGGALWIKIRSNTVTTNLKVLAIHHLIKLIVDILLVGATAAAGTAVLSKVLTMGAELQNDPELKDLFTDNPEGNEVTFEQIQEETEKIIEEVKRVPSDINIDNIIKKGENISEEELKKEEADDMKAAKKLSLFAKALVAIQNLFKKIANGLKSIFDFKKAVGEDESTETSETPAPENPDNKDVEPAAANAAAEDKAAGDADLGEANVVPKEISDETKVEGESAKTEVDEDDTTVSEAATWYNRF